jgi:hypothetical protein
MSTIFQSINKIELPSMVLSPVLSTPNNPVWCIPLNGPTELEEKGVTWTKDLTACNETFTEVLGDNGLRYLWKNSNGLQIN